MRSAAPIRRKNPDDRLQAPRAKKKNFSTVPMEGDMIVDSRIIAREGEREREGGELQNDFKKCRFAHLHDEIHVHLGAANRRKAVSHVVTARPQNTHVPPPPPKELFSLGKESNLVKSIN